MRRKYASSDFVSTMLPSNRKKQFFDFFKTRFSILLKIFLMSLLFSAPFLISYCFKYFYFIANAYIELKSDPEGYLAFFKLTNIIFYAVDVFNITVLLIGYSGVINIFKKMAWSEPISFYKDFFNGIKYNWLPFLLSGLFISIFRFAVKSYDILGNYHFSCYIIETLFYLIQPIFLISLLISEIYDVKVFESYQKATSYYFKKLGYVLLFLIYAIAVTVIRYYVEEVFGMGILGFFLMLGNLLIILPLVALVWYLFWLSCFDQITNKEHFKDYYHKGLSDNFIYNKKYKDSDTFLLK